MNDLFARSILDEGSHERAVARLRQKGVRLPKITELADPKLIPADIVAELAGIDPDSDSPLNLFRVHWYNDAVRRGFADTPAHIALPPELTGVRATIIVAIGQRFPMIRAHKVLAAYGCLVPRLVTGQFDPDRHRSVWPSTGNYCRGGVAIARALGCRSVAVLPELMSSERFAWLEAWVESERDIQRTPGSESNLKEIYDACKLLSQDPQNVILNQFREFGNYIIHRAVTGPALEKIFEAVNHDGALSLRAFVCASGSGGTLAAGDHLKQALGTRIAAVEALECPTLLRNGYGEHNIQGIGDKHVPLIHNALNTDFVIGVSDRASDHLNLLFNRPEGRAFLTERKGVDPVKAEQLSLLGLSGIANVVAAIKLARYLDLDENDALITVATDSAEMYHSQAVKVLDESYARGFDMIDAAEIAGRYLYGATFDNLEELDHFGRQRIFNLGYYTWVEQQGISLDAFDERRSPSFWDGLMEMVPVWDRLIENFNNRLAPIKSRAH